MQLGNGGEAAIRVEGIGLSRTGPDGAVQEILRDLSFSAAAGQITVIIGPSGGGKSSLIRLFNRLCEPDAGGITLRGENIAHLDPLSLRRRVAAVPQKPFMFDGSVLENLQRPALYRQAPLPTADAPEIAHVLDLARLNADFLHRNARTLSLGEQQRVSIARALITAPEILLLDEPTSALDRPTADQIAAMLKDICRTRDITVLLVTHDLRLAEKVADYLLYLEGGRIMEQGQPEELLHRPASAALRRFLAHTN